MLVSPSSKSLSEKKYFIVAIILPGRDCLHLFMVGVRSTIPSKQPPHTHTKEVDHISSYLDGAVLYRLFKRPLCFNKRLCNTLFLNESSLFSHPLQLVKQPESSVSMIRGHSYPLPAWLLSCSCSRESRDGPAQCSVSESMQFVSR